ncbi:MULTISPECIES: GH1 family beta-glucosidase [unclassified Pseudoalteromonas]|uniref:GH1 family beta-glucosidase n=1 Tax=unclassified Pseudoalteromonas TaxID=194690 RepID=UPI0030154CC0
MKKLTLPEDSKMMQSNFIFGVATSSFQIEGAKAQRCESIWDRFCEQPGTIIDNSNGEQACEHVARWQQDIELIESLGVDAYRLSVSWPRVMLDDGQLNRQGIDFYKQLVSALVAKQIKVFVTLYHWDLPQSLEEKGGWLNRDTAYAFADYADVVSRELGDAVYAYTTLNEPFCSAHLGYEVGIHAPGIKSQQAGRQAAHHLLLAHGLAMPRLRQNCPNSLHGIVLNFANAIPATNTQADIDAAKIADDYCNHWYLKPLIDGCYPTLLQQLDPEVQPQLQPEDLDIISAPLDYLGVNYYTHNRYRADGKGWYESVEPTCEHLTTMGWEVVPDSFRDLLTQLNTQYHLPPLYITENGAAFADDINNDCVMDEVRVDYFNGHLNAVHEAINAGVDIRGYFAWSLMDNFEWAEGYTQRFGIVYVDYKTQKRTPKLSALAYRDLITSRK